MKKFIFSFIFLFSVYSGFSQTEKYPVFEACIEVDVSEMPSCFKNEVKRAIVNEFNIPQSIQQENFNGTVNIVFLVTTSGDFKVIYVNSPYKELKTEVERVFATLPRITPAKFNNHPIEMQFVFPLAIPLKNNIQEVIAEKVEKVKVLQIQEEPFKKAAINTLFPEHKSELNIPFTHAEYNSYDYYLNQTYNSHTAVKPYVYAEVTKYVDLDAQKNKLIKPKSTWFGKKLLNEHMAFVKGDNFWFTVDPGADLQIGNDSEGISTFNNTRAIHINGGIGKKFNFSTSFYESQGRFADYVNKYAEYLRPDGGNPAMIPGRGIAKEFNSDAYDYPVAEAYISFTPNSTFNFQFGNGKNFIGDGYRSLFLSDVASPYPYFKINTNFWKIKYTNLWMWMQDVRPELTVDGAYRQKFMAIHYLSWNATKKLNIGLFETVIWEDTNDRGFDVNYLNPLIFYTAAEFSTGSRAGNTLLGLSLKYKLKTNLSLYSQLILDDFRGSEITGSNGWWANKYGIQFGVKYHNAFQINNLYLQAEYNAVRPYTYSHDELNLNYGHNNQPLAHLWGSNFKEVIGIARYTKDRWFVNSKVIIGEKGFDFNNGSDTFSYGGNVFADNDNRASDYQNEIGQGNTATVFIGDLQVGYLVNPSTNLKLFGGITFRNFNPDAPTGAFDKTNSTWVSFGLRTDVFNWNFDF
ncbi:MAG: gliding motility protein RemB [Lutibacter sp.]|uniref:gliding motility protein RemB n=1 Tax=Lutibacter sp. TaxID=1925666 RepID=UPI0017A28C8B|nr:gliding motility protein RemB [Lutibacter sp.]MBT8316464.1 gliding motility protein RemB [Lutibacter sp.]NNJ57324.1 gliding motility protein RemB [Lutibacter sp.]